MPARLQSTAGRCSGSPSRPSSSPSPPGRIPRRPAPGRGRLFRMVSPSPTAALTASAFSHAADNDRNSPGRTRGGGAHGGSARRADREPDLACRAAPSRRGRTVIEAYWKKNGDEPKTSPSTSAGNCSGWPARQVVWTKRQLTVSTRSGPRWSSIGDQGLTPKNLQLVRQVLTEGVWSEVVSLPNVLMQQARSAKDHAPIKAAVTAQLAVALRSSPSRPFGFPISSASSWAKPDQARRAEHTLLARFPAL